MGADEDDTPEDDGSTVRIPKYRRGGEVVA
jgi:hypothetical protein